MGSAEKPLADQLAAEFEVAQRTAYRWISTFGKAVCEDRKKLADYVLNEHRTTPETRAKAMAILGKLPRGRPRKKAPTTVSGASGVVSGQSAVEKAQNGLAKECERLEGYLGEIDDQIREAREGGNHVAAANALKQYEGIHRALVQNRLAQGRLGLETGEMISRDQFKKIMNAFGSRCALGISRMRDTLAESLVGVKTPGEVADKLEPQMILAGMLDPFVAASDAASGVGLPAWVVDTMEATVGDYIGSGQKWLAQRRTAFKEETKQTTETETQEE